MIALGSLEVLFTRHSPIVLLGSPAVLVSVGKRYVAVFVERAGVKRSIASHVMIRDMYTNFLQTDSVIMSAWRDIS